MPKNFDDIRRLFLREKLPYFSIFDARGKRKARTLDHHMEIVDKETRLTTILKYLDEEVEPELDEGVYTIKLQPNMNAGRYPVEEKFVIGDPQTTPSVSSARVGNTGGTIQGLNSIAGFEAMIGLLDRGRDSAERYRDELIDKKLEIKEKEFRIRELEKELEDSKIKGTDSWSDVFKDGAKEHFWDIFDRLVPEKEGKTEIATLKDRRNVPPVKVKKTVKNEDPADDGDASDEDDDTNNEQMTSQEAGKRLEVIVERIDQLFPNEHFIVVLETILDLAENSPAAEMVTGAVKSALKKRRR